MFCDSIHFIDIIQLFAIVHIQDLKTTVTKMVDEVAGRAQAAPDRLSVITDETGFVEMTPALDGIIDVTVRTTILHMATILGYDLNKLRPLVDIAGKQCPSDFMQKNLADPLALDLNTSRRLLDTIVRASMSDMFGQRFVQVARPSKKARQEPERK